MSDQIIICHRQRGFVVVYFVAALVALAFLYGYAARTYEWFPHEHLAKIEQDLKEQEPIMTKLTKGHPSNMSPITYHHSGLVQHHEKKAQQGVTLVTAPWGDHKDWYLAMHLLDMSGKSLHEWRVDPAKVWKKNPHYDISRGRRAHKEGTYVHGTLLYPNGDIVFNLEYFGLFRMNKEGELLWKVPLRTHHSVFEDEEGMLWVCGLKIRNKQNAQYVGLKKPIFEDFILKISPKDGRVLRGISIVKSIYESGYEGIFRQLKRDILHTNDVEVLTPKKARYFKNFQAGDIMVSMRHVNTVIVIDGKTEKIKWSITHPLVAQHDPDFNEDGTISVFNNYFKKSRNFQKGAGTHLLKINPDDLSHEVIYGKNPGQYFFTPFGGKHQKLNNGNLLITEARSGRVFEVTSEGEVVWDWVMEPWDKYRVAEVLEGTRYPLSYADFTKKAGG